MCGIVGIISQNTDQLLASCLEQISHRGPDGSGMFIHNELGLGHVRLAIQDVSENGHQPMISHCGNYVLVYNGEIYNHYEIRNRLESKYPFKSHSDSETLLYAYIEYGSEILKELNGIFAFAIYDKIKNEIFIARDPFGVKPLYYYADEDLFWFSSEIKSLLPLSFDKRIDTEALVNYLTFLYSPGEKTPFKKVSKLLAGHYMKVSLEHSSPFEIKCYYKIPFKGKRSSKSVQELTNELEKRLLKAVERQLLSEVPVGFSLSGGLDSSAIVAMAKKLHPDKKFNCYTIKTNEGADLEEGFANDLHYARKVAQHLDVNLIEVDSTIDIVKDFDKMIYHLDEPQADPAPLNVLQICLQARKDGTIVLLGGTAGDDLFSGYRRHQALQIEHFLIYIPSFIRKAVRALVHLLPADYALFRRARKLTQNIHLSQKQRLVGYFSWMDQATVQQLFAPEERNSIANYNPLQLFRDYLKKIPKEKELLNKMLFLEMKFFLTDHNLNYTDKMSMATGVEVRVPFLDKELLEFSCRIPVALKLKGVTTKYILKRAMEKYLPHEVIYRSKSGFGAPVRQWIKDDMKVYIDDYLSENTINERKLFDFEAVQQLIKDNQAGKIDASYTIWSLLAIESWMRQFYDTTPPNKTPQL